MEEKSTMASGIIKVKKSRNYASILNKSIEDSRLSWKATGILCYLLSRPDDWQVRISDLCNRKNPIDPKTGKTMRGDGEQAVRNAITELIRNGYIIRGKPIKNADGTWGGIEYIVYEEPQEQANTENTATSPHNVKRDTVERDAVNNQPNKTEYTNTDINNGPPNGKKTGKTWQERKKEAMDAFGMTDDSEYYDFIYQNAQANKMEKYRKKYGVPYGEDADEIPF